MQTSRIHSHLGHDARWSRAAPACKRSPGDARSARGPTNPGSACSGGRSSAIIQALLPGQDPSRAPLVSSGGEYGSDRSQGEDQSKDTPHQPPGRHFFFDVLLSAGLPVAAAYIANWAVVNRFRIHDYLGDGQLCFYATTLSVVTTSGLFASKTASLTVKISAGGTMLWVVILANVVWALAITARIRDPATAELSKRRITGVSAALAGAAILAGGIFKWFWGG